MLLGYTVQTYLLKLHPEYLSAVIPADRFPQHASKACLRLSEACQKANRHMLFFDIFASSYNSCIYTCLLIFELFDFYWFSTLTVHSTQVVNTDIGSCKKKKVKKWQAFETSYVTETKKI